MNIVNEKAVTGADILNEACIMWKEYKKLGITDENANIIRTNHKDFCTSYPIVLRYMSMNEYSRTAMKKFIKYIEAKPWTSVDGFLDAQTHYVVTLYKETHPHYNKKYVNTLRHNIKKILQNEHDDFEKLTKESCSIVEANEKRLKEQSLEQLQAFYDKYREEAVDVPIVMSCDIPPYVSKYIDVPASECCITASMLLD